LAEKELGSGGHGGTDADPTKGTESTPNPDQPSQAAAPSGGATKAQAQEAQPVAPGASEGLGVPVHHYGTPPEPPKPPEPAALPFTPEQEAMTPANTAPRPRALRSLLDGFRHGV
jgi:hypothetical protein